VKLGSLFSVNDKNLTRIICLFGIKIKITGKKIFQRKYEKLAIDNKKIVFSNFSGKGFGCNPKYITEEIIKRKLPYKIIWLTNDDSNLPKNVTFFPFKCRNSLREIATAKMWITNVRLIPLFKVGLIKKPQQVYINTWHGSLGIKKIDADANPNFWKNANWGGFEKNDCEAVDYLISNSTFEDKVYKSAFWNKGNIVRLGHARNDVFFRNNDTTILKVKQFYNIALDKKIMLYVPSYRDDKRLDCYGLEYKDLKKALEEKFGKEWIILTRLHPNIAKFQNILPKYDYVINATDYPDIQELLVTADAAITDYSSCIFDFMLSRKPAFIYASDIEQYDTDRGFYYPLTSTPFSVAENNEQLRKNIINFDELKYKQNIESFLKEKGCMEDGHAAERIVDLIEKIMKGEQHD